jgi:hypothetical protein
MTTNKDGKEKTDIRAVKFTLLGIVITAGISWVSATQTASVSFRQSCLARVDSREAVIRSKVDKFFATQGNLISFASHKIKDDETLEKRVDAVSRAAYALTSYLDGAISKTPKLIALDYMELYLPNKTDEEKNHAAKNSENLGDEMDKWNDQYQELLATFEADRKEC